MIWLLQLVSGLWQKNKRSTLPDGPQYKGLAKKTRPLKKGYNVFTALHGMQTRSCDEISVCPSVCPSVKRVHCDKTGEKSIQIFIPCERSFCLVLWEEEWLVGATPSIWNFVSTGPRWSEIAHFKPIIAHSALAVRPSEKSSINTNRKSTTCFPMSLRWSSYVALGHKGGSKMQNGRFASLYVKTVSGKVVGHSLA